MATLMPGGKQTYFDDAGDPLTGGLLYTYAAGTDTPLATYSNKAGTIPNTNPVVLDARGEATIFWGAASYKVSLHTALDVEIWTQDDVDPLALLSGYAPLASPAFTGTPTGLGPSPVTASWGTTARSIIEWVSGTVDPKGLGAVGDGVADDTAALIAARDAAATDKVQVRLGKNTYKTSSVLALDGVSVIGEGPESSKIEFYGAGAAVTFRTWKGNRLAGLRVTSKAAGQTGLVVTGEQGQVEQVYLDGFDTNGLQVGTASVAGCYYTDFRHIYVNNATTQGAVGVLVSGGVPSSNANSFRNIVVSGRWTKLAQIDGTTNIFQGGDFDPSTLGTGSSAIWEINGSHNIVDGCYTELISGSSVPTRIVKFGSSSDGNIVRDLNIRYGNAAPGIWAPSTHFEDLGYFNSVQVRPVGFNFPTVPQGVAVVNLVPNSGFNAWNTAESRPWGWVVQSGGTTVAQETTTVRGATKSLKVTGVANAFNVAAYIYSGSVGDKSFSQVPIGYLVGQQVTCSVWCHSAFANIGNVRVSSNGTGGASVGKVHHTGSGTWELLTASARIPSDATKVWIELRASNGGGSLTGDVYFSEPLCVVGTTLPHYAPRALDDSIAQVQGRLVGSPPISLTDPGTNPSVADGNFFLISYTGATVINSFLNGLPGQEIRIVPQDGNSTLADNSNIATTTGANKLLTSGAVYKLIFDGTQWLEF